MLRTILSALLLLSVTPAVPAFADEQASTWQERIAPACDKVIGLAANEKRAIVHMLTTHKVKPALVRAITHSRLSYRQMGVLAAMAAPRAGDPEEYLPEDPADIDQWLDNCRV